MIAGAHDVSIDLAKTRQWLAQRDTPLTEVILENSAHNIYEDWEREAAVAHTVEFLTASD